MNRLLVSSDPITIAVNGLGIKVWDDLIEYIRDLPYGRNSNREDLGLVLSEGRGTCSSKHGLLKRVADLNKIADIDLVLGIYKMTEENTPGIGNVLTEHSVNYIPEAHCYLKIDGDRKDITTNQSDFSKIEKDIIEEVLIEPLQVSEYKVEYHKIFLKNWLVENNSTYKFDEIWSIREKCINNLSIAS